MVPCNQTEGTAIKDWIIAQAGTIRKNALEIYAWILISLALPALPIVWLGWTARSIAIAVSGFVVIQIAIAVFALRGEGRQ